MIRRHLPAAVFCCALAARVAFLLWTRPPALSGVVQGDAQDYHAYARSLALSGRYEGLRGWRAGRMPGYPCFLAGVYLLCGVHPGAAIAAQALVGAATCVLLFGLGRRWSGDDRWALACAAAGIVHYGMLQSCASLLSENLDIFLLTLFIFLRWGEGPVGPGRARAMGAALGLAYLVRPECGLFSLAVAADLRRRGLAFLAAFLATVSPWLARNALVLHRFLPGTSSAAESFYIGVLGTVQANRLDPARTWTVRDAPPDASEAERGRFFSAATREFYREARLPVLLKAVAINAATLAYPFLPEYDATFVFLLPLSLFGCALWRRRREARMLSLFGLYLAAVYCLAGQTVSRYRLPLAPFFICLAFLGARELKARWGWSRFGRLTAGWAAANLALWLWAPAARQAVLAAKRAALG